MSINLHKELHALVETMIKKMEDGTGTWVKSWSAPNGFPQNFTTKKEYRGFNFFHLSNVMVEKGYTAPYFLTFNQLRTLKGKLKKGSKAVHVYFYKIIEKEDEESSEKKVIPILRRYNVFNIEDTDIEYELENVQLNDNERYQIAEEFVSNTGAEIRYGGSTAYFSPSDDHIQCPKLEYFKDSDNYYATLLHELTHWSGASKRLDRLKKGSMGSKNYGFEELVAELGSVFLCSHLGINIEKNQHPEYLQGWINSLKEKPQILWQAASKAQQAFDYIVDIAENFDQEVA